LSSAQITYFSLRLVAWSLCFPDHSQGYLRFRTNIIIISHIDYWFERFTGEASALQGDKCARLWSCSMGACPWQDAQALPG